VAAALRTLHVDKFRHVQQRRTALSGDLHVQRKNHRELILWNRNNAVLGAMDHWNLRAPVALARDAPVFDSIRNRFIAETLRFGMFCHALSRRFAWLSGPLAGLNQSALTDIGKRRIVSGLHNLPDRQLVFRAELEIALVVSGNGHDRASAVAHQDEVADPDFEPLAIERVRYELAGGKTFLLQIAAVLAGHRVDHLL